MSKTTDVIKLGPWRIRRRKAALGPTWVIYDKYGEPVGWYAKKKLALKIAKYILAGKLSREKDIPRSLAEGFVKCMDVEDER